MDTSTHLQYDTKQTICTKFTILSTMTFTRVEPSHRQAKYERKCNFRAKLSKTEKDFYKLLVGVAGPEGLENSGQKLKTQKSGRNFLVRIFLGIFCRYSKYLREICHLLIILLSSLIHFSRPIPVKNDLIQMQI